MPYYRVARPTDLLVPVALTAPNGAADDHPVTELRTHKLWRTFRTPTTGTQRIVWDRGASGTLDSLFLGNANFPTFDLHGSADNITYGTTIGTSIPVSLNRRTNRRHKWLAVGGSQPRYIRVTPTGTPDNSATYYELAQLTLHSGSLQLGDIAAAPLDWTPVWPATRIALKAGEEIVEDAKAYLETVIQNPDFLRSNQQSNTIQAELLTLLHAAGPGGHFIIYENMGDDAQAFLVHRMEDAIAFSERIATFSASIKLREYV